jgi:hypothetical protein
MRKLFLAASVWVMFFTLTGCNEKPVDPITNPEEVPVVKMVISHEFNGQLINFNSVEYATTHNLVSFAELSYFLTDFEFKKSDGTWMPFAYQALIRARQTPVDTLVFTNLPKGAYQGLRFKLGVDSVNNHADPALWPNEHPLSIMRGGTMHWSWNAGYIFFKLEGRFFKDAPIQGAYSYHIGRDDLITQYTFEDIGFNYNDKVVVLPMRFEAKNFFETPHQHMMRDSALFSHSAFDDEVAEILHGNMSNLILKD